MSRKIELTHCLVHRPDYCLLPERGTHNGYYHIRDATVELLGHDLCLVTGQQEIWEYLPPLPWWKFKKIKAGWYKRGELPFKLVVHSSRVSGHPG